MENRFINLILEIIRRNIPKLLYSDFLYIYVYLSLLVSPKLFIEVRMALGLKIRMRAAKLGLLRLSKSEVAGSLYLGGVL